MIREVNLLQYLPQFMQDYKEPTELLKAENPEFTLAWRSTDRLLYNHFVSTADEYGISRFEKMLGLLPYVTDTLDVRRIRILAKQNSILPYTIRALRERLYNLCGEDNALVLLSGEYAVTVSLKGIGYKVFMELKKILNDVVPENMELKIMLQSIEGELFKTYYHRGGIIRHRHILIKQEEVI